jgi:chromosome segregation ATPase
MTELETHDKRALAIIKLVTEQAEELRETRLQAISDVGQLQTVLEENAYLREQLATVKWWQRWAEDERARYKSRVETAERNVSELASQNTNMRNDLVLLGMARESVTRELDEVREVLKPFAEAADDLSDTHKDHVDIWETPASGQITAAHLRAARTIFLNHNGETK